MLKGKDPLKPATKKAAPSSSKATHVASPVTNVGKGSCKSKSSCKTHIPVCCGCGTYISDDVKALQCDRCQSNEGWKCVEYLNLSNGMFESLTSQTGPNLR